MPARQPLRVVFASVTAGGGHNSVRDSLVRGVQAADPLEERIIAVPWTASRGFDSFYRFCVNQDLQALVYALASSSLGAWLGALLSPRIVLEVVRLVRSGLARNEPEPRQPEAIDVVVSTHLVLTCCFQFARWWCRKPLHIVAMVPDYGPPPPAFFPRMTSLRADVTLVHGDDTFSALTALPDTRPGEVFQVGTVVTPVFSEIGEQVRAEREAKAAFQARLTTFEPSAAKLDVTRPTVTFFGGSAFAGKALPVIEALMERDDAGVRFNVAVLCGRDRTLKARLAARYGQRDGFALFGFLPQEALARLHALTDVPVLGSVAHSSLQEFLETGTGPLLVYHCIPGTEPPYVDWLEQHGLGRFEPRTLEMTALCEEGLGLRPGQRWARLAEGFQARALAIRAQSRERSRAVATVLLELAQRSLRSSASASDRSVGSAQRVIP